MTYDDLLRLNERHLSKAGAELNEELIRYLYVTRVSNYKIGRETASSERIQEKIYIYFTTTQDEKVDPNSAEAALRRSALLVYKASRVPLQRAYSGTFKTASGPIGIGNLLEEKKERDAFMYSLTSDVLSWDGNIAQRSATLKDRRKFGHIKAKSGISSWEGVDVLSELNMIKELKARVGEVSILPDTGSVSKSGGYVEWYPAEIKDFDILAERDNSIRLVRELAEVALVGGYVNTDLSLSNVRKRPDGSIVVIDWGAGFHINHRTDFFTWHDFIQTPAVSSYSVPPEIENCTHVLERFSTEKAIVFYSGVLLTNLIFSRERVHEALSLGHGTRGSKFFYGTLLDYNTLDFMVQDSADISMQDKIYKLLRACLDNDPAKRPTVEELSEMLKEL